ncbi:hypothetical protein GEV33_006238 [Tenebrio molitor]|uniref:Uncharacterized protein n=1 Tax=Tenebrio molitor TaxID=7067 RepID=A0A8J6HLN4_TENMO|nr:hypothetical protein GEV33_006238 [Tenebrio molitor]
MPNLTLLHVPNLLKKEYKASSRTFQNGLSDPDFRYRPRQFGERRGKYIKVRGYDRSVCECCVQRGRLGGVLVCNRRIPTDTSRRIKASFTRVIDPTLQRIISPPCWADVIPQDPSGEQDLTPDCLWPRNPSPGATHIWQGPSASFFYCPPSWHISFTLIYVIRPGVTSPETTRSLPLGRRTPRTFRGYGRRDRPAAEEGLGGPSSGSLSQGLFLDFKPQTRCPAQNVCDFEVLAIADNAHQLLYFFSSDLYLLAFLRYLFLGIISIDSTQFPAQPPAVGQHNVVNILF